jgi:hypothetical protein
VPARDRARCSDELEALGNPAKDQSPLVPTPHRFVTRTPPVPTENSIRCCIGHEKVQRDSLQLDLCGTFSARGRKVVSRARR